MAWFGQSKETIEWIEHRSDVLFYKWKNTEIKKGATLIIRSGQKAIFYADGKIAGVFEEEGSFDIDTEIVPFLSNIAGLASLRNDSGMRAEIYFVNSKELMFRWGTKQRIMIPTLEVPSGIPVGCNGNAIIEFRDYLTFISKVAGVKSSYSLGEIADRIMGEIGPILAECIIKSQEGMMGVSALVGLQANSRSLGKKVCQELDMELFDIGLGVSDVNILSFNYPEEVARMSEKVAAQSFVTNTNKYGTIAMMDGMEKGGGSVGTMGAEMMMGMKLAQDMMGSMNNQQNNTQTAPSAPQQEQGTLFCTNCRKMVSSKFCPDCGTQTV